MEMPAIIKIAGHVKLKISLTQMEMLASIGRAMAHMKQQDVNDSMQKWISCGNYAVCIEGREITLNQLRFHWPLLSEGNKPDKVLYIEENLTDCNTILSDGWVCRTNKDSSMGIYCVNGRGLFALEQADSNSVIVHVRKANDNDLRIGIQYGLILALYQECIGMHGVTLLCGNEIIVLSAPSGTGKTTLAKLLEKFCDAIVINGDFALLHPTGEQVIFEPTPFCGTSGTCLNHRFYVNRVIFLGQAKENNWRKLDGLEAMKCFMNNCFIPMWDRKIQNVVQNNIFKCIDALTVNAYDFVPTREAAECLLDRVKDGERKEEL